MSRSNLTPWSIAGSSCLCLLYSKGSSSISISSPVNDENSLCILVFCASKLVAIRRDFVPSALSFILFVLIYAAYLIVPAIRKFTNLQSLGFYLTVE